MGLGYMQGVRVRVRVRVRVKVRASAAGRLEAVHDTGEALGVLGVLVAVGHVHVHCLGIGRGL